MVHSIMAKSAHNTGKTNDVPLYVQTALMPGPRQQQQIEDCPAFQTAIDFEEEHKSLINLLPSLPSIRNTVQMNTS